MGNVEVVLIDDHVNKSAVRQNIIYLLKSVLKINWEVVSVDILQQKDKGAQLVKVTNSKMK